MPDRRRRAVRLSSVSIPSLFFASTPLVYPVPLVELPRDPSAYPSVHDPLPPPPPVINVENYSGICAATSTVTYHFDCGLFIVALRLMLAIQMESSKIWLIWMGLTALLLLLFRLLLLRELLLEVGSCSSKLNAEWVDWCPSNPPPLTRPGCAEDPSLSPVRGMLSGCAPKPSKFVCRVRSVLVLEYVFWWPLPALFRVGERNVDGECSGADPGLFGDRGP